MQSKSLLYNSSLAAVDAASSDANVAPACLMQSKSLLYNSTLAAVDAATSHIIAS